uniref:Uncharacterized protein n=1 Tax=Anopheles quadriannulatus TaxID=34691 RepID=A0A182X3K0_ANOQN
VGISAIELRVHQSVIAYTVVVLTALTTI